MYNYDLFIRNLRNGFLVRYMRQKNDCKLWKGLRKLYLGNRKIVVFYGQCHIGLYYSILKKIEKFTQKYIIYEMPPLYAIKCDSEWINNELFYKKIDVFIYNYGMISRYDGVPKTKEVLSKLREDSISISLTNADFRGYMPQHSSKTKCKELFCFGDTNLNLLIKDGYEEDDILKLLDENYYPRDKVNEYYQSELAALKQFEKKCDIKIADYIEKFGRDRVLYYSCSHPTQEVILEITKRIMKQLGVVVKPKDEEKLNRCGISIVEHGEAVYPSVCAGLGMNESEFYNRKICPGNDNSVKYTFEEYCREYLRKNK